MKFVVKRTKGNLIWLCQFWSVVACCYILANPAAAILRGDDWTIATLAGTGVAGFVGDGGEATRAELNNPFGVVRGPDGAIWFCEYGGQRIRRINQQGIIETIAGNGQKGYSGDGGHPLAASFNLPHEIRFDRDGNLFVVDMANHVVRKIDLKAQVISTVVGNGTAGYSGDGGPASQAQLKNPHSIQFGPQGDLFICDIGNHVIRRVDMSSLEISTFAGTGRAGKTPNGSAIEGTSLNGPRSIDFDRAGNIWLATREGNQVFKIDMTEKKIWHIAGTGASGFTGHGGPALQATLKGPKGIAVDREGNVYLADTESHSVRMINQESGTIELLAGTGERGDGPEGDARQCKLNRLHGIYVDQDGSILIGDSETHRIRVLRRKSKE